MSAAFTVGALAIAARRANAVGAVRLTLAVHALQIELVRAFGFTEGFAPGAIAEAVRFEVPYLAVRGFVRRGRMLYLTLDPAIVTPCNRFALARFSGDPAEVLARAHRARVQARWASYLVPVPLGALVAHLAPAALVSGSLGRASVGVLVAATLWIILREIVAWRTWGGPISDRYRDALEAELSRKLGLLPLLASEPAPFDEISVDPRPRAARDESRVRPAVLAVAVVAAALGAVGMIAFLKRYAEPRRPPPPVAFAGPGLARAVLRARGALREAAPAADTEKRPRCACLRADSPLWRGGIPMLSILTYRGDDDPEGDIAPKADGGGRPAYDFNLSVVNNAARPLRDVTVTVTFARRSRKGRRVGAVDRGLFWEGNLVPGSSVKWHVRAPGTEHRVDANILGTLEEKGVEPAPADPFFALASARSRALRIHAATMLAYLRDARAADVALAIAGQTPAERQTLARAARAAAPVIACDIAWSEGHVDACIFNGGSRPQSGLELREVEAETESADGSTVPMTRRFAIDGVVRVHEGVRVRFPVEGDAPEEWVVTGP